MKSGLNPDSDSLEHVYLRTIVPRFEVNYLKTDYVIADKNDNNNKKKKKVFLQQCKAWTTTPKLNHLI